jgi:8-oxo-dGTP pyrophosphatase MutT (NUDIX family)
MEQQLKALLASRKRRIVNDNSLVSAAVLIPIFKKNDAYNVLFILRSNRVAHHKGEVSFPGGMKDSSDKTLLDTALRECWEEIGLYSKDVSILGELDDTETHTSGFLIAPFVGIIPYPYKFKLNPVELDDIFDVPLTALADRSRFRQENGLVRNHTAPVYYYEYDGKIIWGATARIVKQLLDLLEY